MLFRVFPHLTTKECPCHVYSNSMPLKQTIGQTVMCDGTTSSFEVESWWHNTLNSTMSLWAWCSLWCALHLLCLSMWKMPCSNICWSITQSFLLQICIVLEAVVLKLHIKLAPGWALIRLNFDPIQEIGPKRRGWALLCEWVLLITLHMWDCGICVIGQSQWIISV